MSPTVKDFLGFVINPPPGDPTRTASSDLLPNGAVIAAGAGPTAGLVPVSDGAGGYTWQVPPTPVLQAAKAYRAAAFTTVASTTTVLPIDTVAYDPGGNVNLPGNRYICPAAGYYLVVVQTYMGPSTAAGQYVQQNILVNGSAVGSGTGVVAQGASFGLIGLASDIVHCNAGDYIQGTYYTTAALSVPIGTGVNNYLSVGRLA